MLSSGEVEHLFSSKSYAHRCGYCTNPFTILRLWFKKNVILPCCIFKHGSNWRSNNSAAPNASHPTFAWVKHCSCYISLAENKDFLYDGTTHWCSTGPTKCSSICIAGCPATFSSSGRWIQEAGGGNHPNHPGRPQHLQLSKWEPLIRLSIRTNCHARGQQLIDAAEWLEPKEAEAEEGREAN